MSTAPPSGASTEADFTPDLNHRHDRIRRNEIRRDEAHLLPPERPTTQAASSPVEISVGPAGARLAPASEQFYQSLEGQTVEAQQVVEPELDASVLDDTLSFRLDDTDLKLPASNLVKLAALQARAASGRSTGAAAISIETPSAVGPLDGLFYESVKRFLDILISATALVLLSPLLLLSAIIIKLTDGGSVFYKHTRVGEGGSEFTCYKFRSMVVNAEKMKAELAFFNSHDDHRTFKIPNDPRVTSFGRLMRRTSIDELPQLWNVLKGDMSIVGPRPPVVTEVEQYTWDDMQRLAVKPGLTCIWQVSGRSRLPFPEQLKMDLEYIENRSLALDIKLMAQTIPAVLSADGAY